MSNFVTWHWLSFDALAADVIAVGRHSLSEAIDNEKSDRNHEISNTMEGAAPSQQHHGGSRMARANWNVLLGDFNVTLPAVDGMVIAAFLHHCLSFDIC